MDDTDIDIDTRPFLDNNSSNNNNNNSSSSSSCSKGSMQSTDMMSMTKGTPLGTVDLSYIEFITIASTDVQSEDGNRDGDGNGDRSERHLTKKWGGLGRERDGNRDIDMDMDRDRDRDWDKGRRGVRKDGTSPHRDGSSPKGGDEEPAPSGRCFPIGTENLDLGTESGNGKQSGDSSSGSSSRMSDPRSRDNSPLLQCTDLTGDREFSGQFTCFFIF